MGIDVKAGEVRNVRKNKYANVVYWTVFYTYTFLIASKWFVYEDGVISYSYSLTTLYQHFALLASIIIGFLLLRRHRLATLKKVLSGVAVGLILVGAIFIKVRSHLAYLIVLAALLGQLADCSLLTYIYEMNNAERLFGIFFCHLLSAGVAAFSVFFDRTTYAFWWVMSGLAVIAFVAAFFEGKEPEKDFPIVEEFPKKLYFPLILACVGGLVAVCSSMTVVEKLNPDYPYARLFYYGGAAFGAVVYYLTYRYAPKPATATLATGFGTAVVGIGCYFLSLGEGTAYLAAAFCGATFNVCMMNLYYILCNIIKKYRDSGMLKLAPIVSNLSGFIIVPLSTFAFYYASETAIKIGLALCLVGDVIVLATSVYWDKGISRSAAQEEYVRYDTVLTKEQVYKVAGLTEQEGRVADMILEGLSLREISNKLFISENTAKTHRSAVYRKLQVGSKEELVKRLEGLA